MPSRRDAVKLGVAGIALAALERMLPMPAAVALTNPDWGVTQADVNALTQRTIPTLTNIRNGMSIDGRYSGQVPEIDQMISTIASLAQQVSDYLVVQGT